MNAFATTMVQDFLVVATGILQSIREDGHAVEGTLFVDALSERDDGGREPFGEDCDWTKGVAEDAPQDLYLSSLFSVPFLNLAGDRIHRITGSCSEPVYLNRLGGYLHVRGGVCGGGSGKSVGL